MKAVELPRKLILEGSVRTADGAGGYSETWQALGVLWGDISVRSGGEVGGRDVPLSAVTYRIVLRAAPYGAPSRPKPDQRLREGSRIYRIQAVADHDPNPRYLTCYAIEETVA